MSELTGFPFKNIIDRHYKQLKTFLGAACFRENSAFWDFFEHVDLNFGLTCNRLLTRKHNRSAPETAQSAFLVLHAFVKTQVFGSFLNTST